MTIFGCLWIMMNSWSYVLKHELNLRNDKGITLTINFNDTNIAIAYEISRKLIGKYIKWLIWMRISNIHLKAANFQNLPFLITDFTNCLGCH